MVVAGSSRAKYPQTKPHRFQGRILSPRKLLHLYCNFATIWLLTKRCSVQNLGPVTWLLHELWRHKYLRNSIPPIFGSDLSCEGDELFQIRWRLTEAQRVELSENLIVFWLALCLHAEYSAFVRNLTQKCSFWPITFELKYLWVWNFATR